jgi:hypothetical protein
MTVKYTVNLSESESKFCLWRAPTYLMAHSQKSIRDHAINRSHPNVDNEAISRQLEDLVKPYVYNQLAYYRSFNCAKNITTARQRILEL